MTGEREAGLGCCCVAMKEKESDKQVERRVKEITRKINKEIEKKKEGEVLR